MSAFQFTPIGHGTDIGANCYRLTFGEHDIIIDSGLHPKIDGMEAMPNWDLLDRPPSALIISHAHVDHCGSSAYLMRMFPSLPCYCTKPTVRIMDRMLHNGVSVMTMLGSEKKIAGYPLYTHNDVENIMQRVVGFDYDREFALSYGCPVTAEFRHAGHVLGSASVLLRGEGHTAYYTGDICAAHQELMRGYERLEDDIRVDTLIIESTRGAHVDDYPISYQSEIDRFSKEIASVLKGNGSVLVPAFALGRMQELMNLIHRKQEEGVIPDCQVYSSGLGRAVYEIYMKYPQYLRDDVDVVPLVEFDSVGDVWNPEVRKKLLSKPCIIVATSGMMIENTPSSMIAMEMVKDERHGIFFVGYLDPDTLGYKVLNCNPGDVIEFTTDGEASEVKLSNIQRFHFSAHAPREDLVEVIERTKPKNVIYVHGDREAVEWMKDNSPTWCRKYAPGQGESVTLESE